MTDPAIPTAAAQLRRAGLRVTAARVAILETVRTGDHLGVEAVAGGVRERVGHVSLQAVYEALHALTAAGLVRRIEPAGSPVRFEGRVGDNHHHVVCRRCGVVGDVDCVVGHAPCLRPSDTAGYAVDEAEVTFWGLCPDCRDRPVDDPSETVAAVSPDAPSTARGSEWQAKHGGAAFMTDRPITTTDAGIPAPSDEHSQSVGPNGPLLLQDHYLIQKLAHFNRERVPERVVHAKGGGAYGVLEITEDVSQFTKAKLFQKGARTESLVRFSSVAGELGSADAGRDPRGFAIKFYTEDGNYDLVGNNTPIFFIRDPQKFPDFIHSQKRRPDTHLRDHNMQWDFWTLSPESAHQVTLLMTDRGTPASWRHMNGYGSHTFLWYNAAGDKFWVKYHFKTDQGIKNFTADEADRQPPDVHLKDLYEAIERGDYPSWTVQVQIMPFEEAADYRFNPFDLTKVWPHADYPPITIGKWTLTRNPENYFAEIEQAAFEPANFVPGIGPSPDKMLQGRLFSYPDAHRYRIGANYLQLPVNRPKAEVHSYNFDGPMTYRNPEGPVYAPNSFGGPAADPELWKGESYEVAGEIVRSAYTLHREDDDYVQPRALWEKVLSDVDRDHLVSNIVGHASAPEVTADMKKRVVEYWRNVHKDLGDRVAAGLGVNGS